MRRNIFSSLASLHASFFALSIFFILGFPFLQLSTPQKTESVMTEYGENFTWKVDRGESMGSIASTWYGDASFTTTLWNDNPWIEDPSVIEPGWVLEIRRKRPILPEPLKPELFVKQKFLERGTYIQTKPVVFAQVQPVQSERVAPVLSYSGGPLNDAQIQFLGQCESGMTATRNSGNGYYGAFQFSPATWRSMNTGYERADMAPIEVQKEAVQRLLSRSSIFSQFPGCARKMQGLGMI